MEWLAPVNDYSGVIIILVVFLLIYLLIVVKSGQQSLETVSRELVGRMDGVEDELHHHIDRDTQVLRGALNTVRERVVAAAEVWDKDSQELKESVVSEMKSEKGQFEKTVNQVRTPAGRTGRVFARQAGKLGRRRIENALSSRCGDGRRHRRDAANPPRNSRIAEAFGATGERVDDTADRGSGRQAGAHLRQSGLEIAGIDGESQEGLRRRDG